MKKYEDPHNSLYYMLQVMTWVEKKSVSLAQRKNKKIKKYIIRWILIELPNTTIIWWQILPRLKWRYSENQTAMHESRYKNYNSIASFVAKLGGHYIKYPDICRNYTYLNQMEFILHQLEMTYFWIFCKVQLSILCRQTWVD